MVSEKKVRVCYLLQISQVIIPDWVKFILIVLYMYQSGD
jgi:hypothetical protein